MYPSLFVVGLLVWASLSLDAVSAWAIDSDVARQTFGKDATEVPLAACEVHLGPGANLYPALDIQKRLATWIISLFLLIGSMQFAPLGWRNVICVVVHLVSDPNSSFESLLSKLHALKEHSKRSQQLHHLPHRVQHAVAAILAAREECNVYTEAYAPQTRRRSSAAADLFPDLAVYLGQTSTPTPHQQKRRDACLQAANELSDARDTTMSKAIIGTINYVAVVVTAFLHIYDGEFNNRTGHSIGAAMRYFWLIPVINLSAVTGTFSNKRSAEDVLKRLQENFSRVDNDETVNSSLGLKDHTQIPHVSRFSSTLTQTCDLTIHAALPYSGGNPTFRPHQSTWGNTTTLNLILSHLPTLISTLSAALISFTSPTRGVGCRSVQHLSIYTGWLVSALLTTLIRRCVSSARHQWTCILVKDVIFFPLQLAGLFGGFVGWFNSCFCWSAVFSLGRRRAYIVMNPGDLIEGLARREWPALVGLALGFQVLVMFLGVWWWYRDGLRVFVVEERDRLEGRYGQE